MNAGYCVLAKTARSDEAQNGTLVMKFAFALILSRQKQCTQSADGRYSSKALSLDLTADSFGSEAWLWLDAITSASPPLWHFTTKDGLTVWLWVDMCTFSSTGTGIQEAAIFCCECRVAAREHGNSQISGQACTALGLSMCCFGVKHVQLLGQACTALGSSMYCLLSAEFLSWSMLKGALLHAQQQLQCL